MSADKIRGRAWLQGLPWQQLRSLPSVTLAIAALWLLVFPVVHLGFASHLTRAKGELKSSVDYFIQHPMVQVEPRMKAVLIDVMPGYQGNEVFEFLSDTDSQEARENLRARVVSAFDVLNSHPYRVLGVVPARLSVFGFLFYPMVQVGWLALLTGIMGLLLLGPPLERSWGKRVFAGVCVLAWVASAMVFALVNPKSNQMLIGGGTLVAMLSGAIAIRFRTDSIQFLEWLSPRIEVDLEAPAWLAGLFVLLVFTFAAGTATTGLPASMEFAPAPSALLAGLALGALCAYGLKSSGFEARLGDPPATVSRNQAAVRTPFDPRRVERARAAGDLDKAIALLRQEIKRSARNRSAVLLYWEVALERGEPAEATPVMLQLIREEMRRGALDHGADHWMKLVDGDAEARLTPDELLRLLPTIARAGGSARVTRVLEQVIPLRKGQAEKAGLSPRAAAQFAELGMEACPDLAASAAEIALTSKEWNEPQRARLESMVKRSSFEVEDELPPIQVEKGETAPDAFYAEQDRSSFGDASELGDLAADELDPDRAVMWPSAKVASAVPIALEEDSVTLMVSGKGGARLGYSRICGVSQVGVKGVSAKPVVLIDLLLNGPDPADGTEALRVIRFQSDQFDPRSVCSSSGSPLEALETFVAELVKRSEKQLLDGSRRRDNGKLRIYASLADYERTVLRVVH